MPENNSLNWWERNVLWLVFALLIAGWWAILEVLLGWKSDGRVVCFTTLNLVLTLRFAAGAARKRSADFNRVFSIVAQMIGVCFLITLITFPVMLFVGAFIAGGLDYFMASIAHTGIEHSFKLTYALVVSGGTAAPALFSVSASRRRLLTMIDNQSVT